MCKVAIKEQYHGAFTGLGCLGKHHITLNESHTSVINPPQRIPHSLKDN